jgi:hypothetical protein
MVANWAYTRWDEMQPDLIQKQTQVHEYFVKQLAEVMCVFVCVCVK